MNIGEARKIIGSISLASKMPGTGWGISAATCKTGSKLAAVAGSACAGCYALKGTYTRKNVAIAHQRRLAALKDPRWADAMVVVLSHLHRSPIKVDLGELGVRRQKQGLPRWIFNEPGWHRWFDSGDLQSVEHLAAICDVARRTPQIRHWLPTQELSMVRRFVIEGGIIPSNLVIRISSVMIDDDHRRAWPTTSSVFVDKKPQKSHVCPAPHQEHHCRECRACWSSDVAHVAYARH